MSKIMYSVFDTNGFGVTGQLFHSQDDAAAFALRYEVVMEFGPCHAGVPCNDHDEFEQGLCYHCAAQLPSVPSLSAHACEEQNAIGICRCDETKPHVAVTIPYAYGCDECGLYAIEACTHERS